jgi:hypothetical protein
MEPEGSFCVHISPPLSQANPVRHIDPCLPKVHLKIQYQLQKLYKMCHKVGKMIRNDYGLVQAWEEAVVAFLKY